MTEGAAFGFSFPVHHAPFMLPINHHLRKSVSNSVSSSPEGHSA